MTKTAHRLQPITLGAALTAILCAVIWAGQSIAVKVALVDFPVNTMMALRFILPVPLFFAVARFKGISLTPKGMEWKAMAVNATRLCTTIALFT